MPVYEPSPAEDVRFLTREQLESVLSGSGLRRYSGPAHSEVTPDLYPWRARGLYPNPGLYHQMLLRNPVLASGAAQTVNHISAAPWPLTPPKNPTVDGALPENELAQTHLVRQVFRQLKGGFTAFLRQGLSMLWYGFSAFEIVMRIADRPAEMTYWPECDCGAEALDMRCEAACASRERLTVEIPIGTKIPSRLRWLAPWTIEDWIVDADSGDLLWALQVSEKGRVPIPAAKVAHFASQWYGDNYEGVSVLRPLHWIERAMDEEFVSDRISRERWGEGVVIAEWTGVSGAGLEIDYDDSSIDNVEAEIKAFLDGRRAFMIPPPGWRIGIDFGGTSFPDPIPRLQYYQHLLSRSMADVIKDMGTGGGKFGTKAGAQAVADERGLSLAGLCLDFADTVRQEIIAPIGRANGWDLGRLPELRPTMPALSAAATRTQGAADSPAPFAEDQPSA